MRRSLTAPALRARRTYDISIDNGSVGSKRLLTSFSKTSTAASIWVRSHGALEHIPLANTSVAIRSVASTLLEQVACVKGIFLFAELRAVVCRCGLDADSKDEEDGGSRDFHSENW